MTDIDIPVAADTTEPPAKSGRMISIPRLGLVALVGASGCGKSTWAAKHFLATEVLSSDTYRAIVSDDELDQTATSDAFDVLHYIAAKRLERGKLIFVDVRHLDAYSDEQTYCFSRRKGNDSGRLVALLEECIACSLITSILSLHRNFRQRATQR